MLSVIIPTYNEGENIKRLIPRIFGQFMAHTMSGEIIIVDDGSPDGTAAAAKHVAKEFLFPVRIVSRPGKLGLSSAVLEGFRRSEKPVLCVMDADFSHPPEAISWMYKTLMEGCDMVVGSRHVQGGSIEGWPLRRKLISKGAKLLARPITSISDPMSGFFMLRRGVIDGIDLDPRGYKILLEILAKGKYKSVREIPIAFVDRKAGQSKMDRKEMWNYLRHSTGLWRKKRPRP